MMMENAKTYITSKLSELTQEVPEVKIVYKFDFFSKEHLIKVLPLEEYQSNTNYQAFEENLLFDFIENYPYDNLVFLSEKDWIDIDKPDEIYEGNKYKDKDYSLISDIQNEVEINFRGSEFFSFSDINDDFIDFTEEIIENYNTIIVDTHKQPINFNNSMFEDFYESNYFEFHNIELIESKNEAKSSTKENIIKKTGNDNFALAA